MRRSTVFPKILLVIVLIMTSLIVTKNTIAQLKPAQSGYAPVNGLKMYYEVYGSGFPLVVIHGAFMSINTAYGEVIPGLSKKYKVIAVELQGHGRTADIDRPFTFDNFADDIAGLLKFLKIDNADIMGYSLGGGVAIKVGIKYPQLVRKLVVISAPYKFEGWYPETRQMFPTIRPEFFEGTPIKTEYVRLAPDTAYFGKFVNKLKDFAAKPYDLGADNVKAIKAPMFIIFGDADGVIPEHGIEMYRLKGGGVMGDIKGIPESQLAIFPGSSHVSTMMHPDWLLAMVPPFLDAPLRNAK